jgi:YggT family protein
MGSNYFTNPMVFLIQVLFGTYILAVMLRFILQLVKADFYNPISQFIVKVTTPVLHPIRRIIPAIGGIDTASLLLMWLLKGLELGLIAAIVGIDWTPLLPLAWAIPDLLALTINLFLIAIFIQVIISWVSPGSYSPATGLLHALTSPLLRPAQRLIPPISGFDFAPWVVLIGLTLLRMLLLPPVKLLTNFPNIFPFQ